MDHVVCRRCGLRTLAASRECPSCGRPLPPARLRPQPPSAPPHRDVLLFVLHLALASSVVWMVARVGAPWWALAPVPVEVSVAASALVRSRVRSKLVALRAVLYVALAAVWIATPTLALVLLTNAVAVWSFAYGTVSGRAPPSALRVRVREHLRGPSVPVDLTGDEVLTWRRLLALPFALVTWWTLVLVLRRWIAG